MMISLTSNEGDSLITSGVVSLLYFGASVKTLKDLGRIKNCPFPKAVFVNGGPFCYRLSEIQQWERATLASVIVQKTGLGIGNDPSDEVSYRQELYCQLVFEKK